MLWFYRLLFLPSLVLLAPYYILRMRRRGGYGEKFSQRFGANHRLVAKPAGVRRIWLQAVSVGEVLAIEPVIDALRKEGGIEIYLTTTTSTGYQLAREKFRDRVIGTGYFPIDWWFFSKKAWRSVQPDLVILTEGERWPEHIHQAGLRRVPVIGLNARLSDRSFSRLQRFRFANRAVLAGLTKLLPASAQDEARFRALGVPQSKLFTTGNIKLDVQISPLSGTERTQLARELGLVDGLVLLGSSTWPGEEAALLQAWRAAQTAGIVCSLLIVPRHAERRLEIEKLLEAAKVNYHFRSRGAAERIVDVAVADTTGELRRLTQLADLVFVGKSLPPNDGGQTPVESAALQKPLLFGPRMSNFRTIAAELVTVGAAHTVNNDAELQKEVVRLLSDATARSVMSVAAGQWHRQNAGAVERTIEVIRAELGVQRLTK